MRVKGSIVRARLDFVQERHGQAGLERLWNKLGPADRAACNGTLTASWVPFDLALRLDGAITELFFGGREGAGRELGAESARRNLTGIYKMFVEQAGSDPLRLLRSLVALHSSFYDWGSSSLIAEAPGRCRMVADYQNRADRLNCQTAAGFYAEALRLIGLKGVQARELACQALGNTKCEIELRWTP